MNYAQNEKLLQVGEENLIIGIDVGSKKHYVRAFDGEESSTLWRHMHFQMTLMDLQAFWNEFLIFRRKTERKPWFRAWSLWDIIGSISHCFFGITEWNRYSWIRFMWNTARNSMIICRARMIRRIRKRLQSWSLKSDMPFRICRKESMQRSETHRICAFRSKQNSSETRTAFNAGLPSTFLNTQKCMEVLTQSTAWWFSGRWHCLVTSYHLVLKSSFRYGVKQSLEQLAKRGHRPC